MSDTKSDKSKGSSSPKYEPPLSDPDGAAQKTAPLKQAKEQ